MSCVSTGTYKALQVEKSKSDSLYTWAMQTLKASQADNDRLNKEKAALKDSINDLTVQMGAVKQNSALLHTQLENGSQRIQIPSERGCYEMFYRNIADAINGKDTLRFPAQQALLAVEMLLIAEESNRLQKTIFV